MDAAQLEAAFARLDERAALDAGRAGVRVGATVYLREVEASDACGDFPASVQSTVRVRPGEQEVDGARGMLVLSKAADYFIPFDDIAHVEVWEERQ